MLSIIVADDTKGDLVLITRILKQAKLLNPIVQVSGAAECVNDLKMREHAPGRVEPCLVFLDLIMTQESGLDVLRYLQKSEYRTQCLVVMLSGLQDVKAIHEGYQLGAKTFLLKPLKVMDVVELVNSLPEIGIEETDEGYVLHWKESLSLDSGSRRMTSRIEMFAA